MKLTKRDNMFILCCLLPAVFLTIIFLIFPLFRGLSLSFTNASSTSINGDFVGLENYLYMFQDEYFFQAFKNTIILLAVVPFFVNLIALIFAFFLTQGRLRESNIYRFLFFFPSIISITAVGILWANIYSPTLGLVKQFATFLGWDKVAEIGWLGDERYVLSAIIVTMIWQAIGYYMVMYIASIDAIDTSIFEAATIDGCSTIKKIFLIAIPVMKNMIGVTFILTISSTIRLSYILVSAMTAGGPYGSCEFS